MNGYNFWLDFADNPGMADSYFDLLTQQEGLPAKQFDPLEELKLLRRKLALRLHKFEPSPEVFAVKEVVPLTRVETGPVSLEAVVSQVESIEETLASLTTLRTQQEDHALPIVEGISRPEIPLVESHRNVNVSNDGMLPTLSTVNLGLIALGIVAVVFELLNFSWGLAGNLPFASWVSASGAAIIAIGLTGRIIASR